MKSLLEHLISVWDGDDSPFLYHSSGSLSFSEIRNQEPVDLTGVEAGQVVALIGDFDPRSIHTLLSLLSMGVTVVPLTNATKHQHEYFFDAAQVDVIVEGATVSSREVTTERHELLEYLREERASGLILFSTGTTGRPKAILHDFRLFLRRFEVPRPTLRTLNFLLFDHIGGLNTLFHTLFNRGVVVAPEERTVKAILQLCQTFQVEVLPATPTFLRLMLMTGGLPDSFPKSIRIVTYGTERMDEATLEELAAILPDVDFRQTFGMSELGILRVKSESRTSLYMKIGGEGVETRVVDETLQIRSKFRMLGYLNADSPFDECGWYDTQDVVELKGEFLTVKGRSGESINVGGLKFLPSEVERVALSHPSVLFAKASARENPLTGQHVELMVEPKEGQIAEESQIRQHLEQLLPRHMVPSRISTGKVPIGHRFKRS